MNHPTTSAVSPSVRVPLSGKDGAGYLMILDAADWQHVRETWGEVWTRTPTGFGRFYVTSHRTTLRALTGQPAEKNVVARLARLLLGAQRGDVVIYEDGDTLNLTRRNLFLRTGAKATAWKAERAQMRSAA